MIATADLEAALFQVGGYLLKPSSKEAVVASTRMYEAYKVNVAQSEWAVSPYFRTLGQTISCTGHCGQCMQDTARSIWRAFWANSKLLRCKAVSIESRIKAWDKVCAGIFEYRLANAYLDLWPCGQLDSLA